MPSFESSLPHEHGLPESLGVLIVNLGTPDEPTPSAVRRYLRQFLSDPRVVEYPRLLWWLILNLIILVIRPSRSAAAYREIWTDKGSPLLLYSQDLADGIRDYLASRLSGNVCVELAMTYGNPSVDAALEKFRDQRVRRVVVLPLYPQYSGTTTGPVFDAVAKSLQRQRWVPELRFINHYHDANGYIAALAASVRSYWDINGRGEKLLFSFHGVPERTLTSGDPYHCHCHKTARLLAEALGIGDDEWQVSFQSRVGREQWLRPYTDETVKQLGSSGLGRLDVMCPGFSVDCLETLEEIEMQNAEFFTEAGGNELRYIPALNARPDHVSFLGRLVTKHVAGWPEASSDYSESEDAQSRQDSRQRAVEMGADQ